MVKIDITKPIKQIGNKWQSLEGDMIEIVYLGKRMYVTESWFNQNVKINFHKFGIEFFIKTLTP